MYYNIISHVLFQFIFSQNEYIMETPRFGWYSKKIQYAIERVVSLHSWIIFLYELCKTRRFV